MSDKLLLGIKDGIKRVAICNQNKRQIEIRTYQMKGNKFHRQYDIDQAISFNDFSIMYSHAVWDVAGDLAFSSILRGENEKNYKGE